jgi:hypothetical protein
MRNTYELLEGFIAALRGPAVIDESALDGESAARLGYLIAAARMLAGAPSHESWTRLGTRLRQRQAAAPETSDVVLLKADAGRNSLDDLARSWGFRKGLDPRKIKEIVSYGAT